MKKLFSNKLFLLFLAIIVVIIWSLSQPKTKNPVVIDTDPLNGTEEVSLTKQIDINFSNNLNEKAKDDVSIIIEPQISFDSTWLTTTYKIIPKANLNNNTSYKIKVNYKKREIYNFSFSTQIFSQEDIEKYGPEQSRDDYDYGQALIEVVKKYPFYPNLPIRTSDFVVYFDFEKEQFIIDILKSNLDAAARQELINQAIEYIKKIGGKEPIKYYIFNPES